MPDHEPRGCPHGASFSWYVYNPSRVEVHLPRFDTRPVSTLARGVPAIEVGGKLVTTVFDLVLAQFGVWRDGLPGTWRWLDRAYLETCSG